jgi:Putative Ig domain
LSMRLRAGMLAACIWWAPVFCGAQQGAATGEPITIESVSLPTGYLRQPYRFPLQSAGGITPRKWHVTRGELPRGISLDEDGLLEGTPTVTGPFAFTVLVSDSGKPPQERSQELVLEILAPLLVEWSRYPKITGREVGCAVKVSNQTGEDFDLTVIALAVNEIGRATAVGYQHFTLKKQTFDLELAFAEHLPRGSYQLNVDAVAEVPATNTIYRVRLVTAEKLEMQQGP